MMMEKELNYGPWPVDGFRHLLALTTNPVCERGTAVPNILCVLTQPSPRWEDDRESQKCAGEENTRPEDNRRLRQDGHTHKKSLSL